MTYDELMGRMRTVWPDFLLNGERDREELFRRLHRVMFGSEHVRQLEETTGRSYFDLGNNYRETIHRVRRDRRNHSEIWKALQAGQTHLDGHRIAGKTPSSCYLYRWDREEVEDMFEMIEEATR